MSMENLTLLADDAKAKKNMAKEGEACDSTKADSGCDDSAKLRCAVSSKTSDKVLQALLDLMKNKCIPATSCGDQKVSTAKEADRNKMVALGVAKDATATVTCGASTLAASVVAVLAVASTM
jgi:hypothetical protein